MLWSRCSTTATFEWQTDEKFNSNNSARFRYPLVEPLFQLQISEPKFINHYEVWVLKDTENYFLSFSLNGENVSSYLQDFKCYMKKKTTKKTKTCKAWARIPDSPLLRFLAEQVGQCLAKLKLSARLGPRQTFPTASPKPPSQNERRALGERSTSRGLNSRSARL